MSVDNPIQYSSRTFNTILNDLNEDSELVDKPEWFKRAIAGFRDHITMYENAVANQSFPRTAFTRQAVADLLTLIDYNLDWKSTSSGTLLFFLDPDSVEFPKIVESDDLVGLTEGTLTVSSQRYESREDASVTEVVEGFTTDYATNNYLTVDRVFLTGEKVRLATTGTLPSGLSTDTDYYVIYISDTSIALAESLSDAFSSTEITLTDDGTGSHSMTLYSFQVEAYQQTTQDDAVIGTSDGSSEWQSFDLPDYDILEDTLSLTINGNTWSPVDSLIVYGSDDTVFLLRYNTDGSSYVLFGNGTYGKIPENYEITASYAYGGGSLTNVSSLNKIITYAGSDSDILGVTNGTTFTGGSAEEDLETAKIVAPQLLKARDRFVTIEDGESLALSYEGVSRASVIRNYYGVLSCKIPIVPSGGGTPSTALKEALQEYLIDRTIMEAIDVRVEDPTYYPVSVTASVNVSSGYSFDDIIDYITLALRLIFSESTYEIQQEYETDGIATARATINSKWGYSFTSTDNTQIITLLENIEAPDFGQTFYASDVLSAIDTYVSGVNYIIISSPTFPLELDEDTISQEDIDEADITEV